MSNPGFIYVLINHSMDGLVKIGKTQRSPEDRVSELSSVTGVPTPFYLAYQEYFNDCDRAEVYIHERLSSNRVSDNTEFFNVSLNVAIRVISEANTLLNRSENQSATTQSDYIEQSNVGTLPSSVKPSDELYRLASECLVGSGKALQDAAKAISLYERAAKLGCSYAYLTLGNIFRDETFVKKDPRKAIEYYEKGVAHADNHCWAEMASIFHLEHFSNWEKCWANYFSSDDFLQNTESANSIDCNSNSVYSFSYICQIQTWVAFGRDIDLRRYLTPIINHIHTDKAYGGEVAQFCRNAINPRMGKQFNEFYSFVLKEFNRVLINQGSSENEKAQSISGVSTKKSFWSRMFSGR